MEDGGKHDGHDLQMDSLFGAEKKPPRYRHKEAYCLMTYQCEKCHRQERLWNSRDGVTPFVIGCSYCDGSAKHTDWIDDRETVDHIPHPGQRIFIDLPKEIHVVWCRKRVEGFWNHADPDLSLSKRYPTKEAAFKALYSPSEPGEPFIIRWEE